MREERIDISIGSDIVAGFITRPAAKTFPVLLCIHGFSTSHQSSKIQYFTDHLPSKGWGILSIDLRYHGESSGNIRDIRVDENVRDVRTAYAFARDNIEGAESVSVFGSSYGGMLAIILAIEQPTLPLLGLVAPVTDFVEQRGIAKTDQDLKEWKDRGVTTYRRGNGDTLDIGYQYYESMKPYHRNLYAMTSNIKSNTFIVQGDADKSVPISLTKKFYNLLDTEKELVVVPGADHYFSNHVQYQNMLDRFVEFYTMNL